MHKPRIYSENVVIRLPYNTMTSHQKSIVETLRIMVVTGMKNSNNTNHYKMHSVEPIKAVPATHTKHSNGLTDNTRGYIFYDLRSIFLSP